MWDWDTNKNKIVDEIIITLLKLESMLFLRNWVEHPPLVMTEVAATSGSISLPLPRPPPCSNDDDADAELTDDERTAATRRSLFVGDKIDAWIALILAL